MPIYKKMTNIGPIYRSTSNDDYLLGPLSIFMQLISARNSHYCNVKKITTFIFLMNTNISQVTFIYIAFLTIQIVSKQLHNIKIVK